jgi:hypothetical protein
MTGGWAGREGRAARCSSRFERWARTLLPLAPREDEHVRLLRVGAVRAKHLVHSKQDDARGGARHGILVLKAGYELVLHAERELRLVLTALLYLHGQLSVEIRLLRHVKGERLGAAIYEQLQLCDHNTAWIVRFATTSRSNAQELLLVPLQGLILTLLGA